MFTDGNTVLVGRMVYCGLNIRFELETWNGNPCEGSVFVGRFVQ